MTTTSSWTVETLRVSARFTAWPTVEVDALAHQRGEAGERTRHPVGPEGQEQAAEAAVRVGRDARSKLVAVFWTMTVAPGTGAPLGSLTVPSMTPVVAWDCA